MKKQPFPFLRHGVIMVRRNFKSYAFLSVTIILSFSLLLGYLVWSDSNAYNNYKQVFSQDRNIVTVYDARLNNASVAKMLKEKATAYGSESCVHFENAYFGSVQSKDRFFVLEDGRMLSSINAHAICVPSHAWCLYATGWKELDVVWIDGKQHYDYHLNSGEILIDERLYSMFGLADKNNLLQLQLGQSYSQNSSFMAPPFTGEFTVVGLLVSDEPLKIEEDENGSVFFASEDPPPIAFSSTDLNSTMRPDLNWFPPTVVFYSHTPEQIDALIRSTGITTNIHAVYESQDNARDAIQGEIRLKMIITIALLVLLGINLYSSFSNALNDRKFEVGVRRAIGASKWAIVRQFLYESILVMLTNIFISIWLVLTAALIYKVIREHFPENEFERFIFTLTISPHSIGMFAICSLTLTLVFSLIFAYKTTRVQIVDYLKSE